MSEPHSAQATPAIHDTDVLIVGGGLSGSLLAMQLLILPGNLGLGIAADAGGAVLDARSQPAQRLFAMGPPLRGMWWESTAVTDVALQAKALAQRLVTLPSPSP